MFPPEAGDSESFDVYEYLDQHDGAEIATDEGADE
jgi:hypothetical protein